MGEVVYVLKCRVILQVLYLSVVKDCLSRVISFCEHHLLYQHPATGACWGLS